MLKINTKEIKALILFCFLLIIPLTISAAISSDAIAIRVIPNLNNYSPLRWYTEKGFSGSPQSLTVDGFEAVRDGRTVYVNAANMVDTDSDSVPDKLYANIYLISYVQEAEGATVDIFGQILSHWKFNTNIAYSGNCNKDASKICSQDLECGDGDYCAAPKAKIIRDTKRLSDLADFKTALENYKNKNGKYPVLSSGSYLPNVTISTWPSWQETLGQMIGSILPVDPINRLGACSGGESISKFGSEYSTTTAGCYGPGPSFARSCSDAFWDYLFVVDKSGNYKAFAETSNNDSSPYGELHTLTSPIPVELICPAAGIQHKVEVYVDGALKGFMCNDAVAPVSAHQFGYVDLGFLTAGTHTMKYRWVNDWTYDPDKIPISGDEADSNLRIYQVGLIGDGDYNSVTCWNESTQKFADPTLNSQIDLPASSSAYIYTVSSDGKTFKLNMGFETAFTSSNGFVGGKSNNDAPILSCGALSGFPRIGFSSFVGASDPEGDALKSWVLTSVSPANWSDWVSAGKWGWDAQKSELALSSTNMPNLKKISAQKAGNEGNYIFKVSVADVKGNIANKECTINIKEDIPHIDVDNATFEASSTKKIDFVLKAKQVNTKYYPLTHSLTGTWPLTMSGNFSLVGGEYVYSVTGKLSVLNTFDSANTIYNFTSSIADVNGVTGTANFNVTITNTPPSINNFKCPESVLIGKSYSCVINAVDRESNKISYSFTGLPAGLSGDADTGDITGSPTSSGIFNISIVPKDEFGYSGGAKNIKLRVKTFCGDGVTQSVNDESVSETCDDGNLNNDDSCTNSCRWTCRSSVIPSFMSSGKGDGVLYGNNSNTTVLPTDTSTPSFTHLKLSGVLPTPYIWVANTGTDKISKIRTNDGLKRICQDVGGVKDCSWQESTWETRGQIIGTYDVGDDPSRTAVNAETGDVWVGNRAGQSVTKLDIEGNLKKTCPVGGVVRGLAIEENGDVWVGDYGGNRVLKISGDDSNCAILNSISIAPYPPYGLSIDEDGILWAAIGYPQNGVAKINPNTGVFTYHNSLGGYGITIDFDKNIWLGGHVGHTLVKFSQANLSTPQYYDIKNHASSTLSGLGVTIDINGNIWASTYTDNGIVKFAKDGSFLFRRDSGGSDAHGACGDSYGQVWVVNNASGNLRAYDLSGNDLGVFNAYPGLSFSTAYTYSDMTGLNRAMLLRSGSWTSNPIDGGFANQRWGVLEYQQAVPSSRQKAEIFVRSNNDQVALDATLWRAVSDWNANPDSRTGRYMQVKIKMRSNQRLISPAVWDLKLICK